MKVIKSLSFIFISIVAFSCNASSTGSDLENNYSYIQSQFDQLQEIDRSRFYFEDTIFPDIVLNDSLNISDLGEGHLYLRLSELHCQECINDISLFINEHFAKRKFLVVILGQFKSERAMLIYLRRLNLLETNWFLINEIEGHDLEAAQAPYAFLLKDGNRIDNLWLPHYSLPNLSNEYILAISTRLAK